MPISPHDTDPATGSRHDGDLVSQLHGSSRAGARTRRAPLYPRAPPRAACPAADPALSRGG